MRISDWSSDVFSSDLSPCAPWVGPAADPLSGDGNQVRQPGTRLPVPRHLRDHRDGPGHGRPGGGNPETAHRQRHQRAAREHLVAGVERRQVRLGEAELRSEEHTSELQSLMRISYAVFCLKKKKKRETTEVQS